MAVPREILTAYVQRNRTPPDNTILPNDPAHIKKFQRFHGLTPDGIIGPKTNAMLRRTHTRLGYASTGKPILMPHPRTSPGPTGRRIEYS